MIAWITKQIRIVSSSITVTIFLLSTVMGGVASAFASSFLVDEAIASMTTEILKKEIDLERFLLNYKVSGNKEPKLRQFRYFLGQQASLGLFLGGDIVTIEETGRHLNSPAAISINNLRSAYKVQLIGSIIGAASSTAELCSNSFIALKNKIRKEDPGNILLIVQNRLRNIDESLKERHSLIDKNRNSPIYKINAIEGKLLKDYRDWCVYEFTDIYADLKAYQASENLYYFLNAASNTIYSVSGHLTVRSLQNPQFASSSIITGLTGDGISIISAPASYMARKLLYKHYAKKIYRKLQQRAYDIETESADNLASLNREVLADANTDPVNIGRVKSRLAAYELWNQKYDEYVGAEMEILRRYDKIALQSVIFGPIISGTFLAEDVMAAAAYYGNRNRLKTANNLTFAGAITSGCGSAIGLGATTWYYADELLNQRKLKREGKLPEQLLQERLKALDQVELMVSR